MPADQEYKAVGWSDQFGSDLKNMAKGDDSEVRLATRHRRAGAVPQVCPIADAQAISRCRACVQNKKKDEKTSAIEFLKKLDEVYERKQAEDKLTKEDEIMYTFRRLLKEWEQELADRPETEKRTAQVSSQQRAIPTTLAGPLLALGRPLSVAVLCQLTARASTGQDRRGDVQADAA
jgi:hypothetical protein